MLNKLSLETEGFNPRKEDASTANMLEEEEDNAPRESRGWCEDSFGVFCMLFNAVKGDNNEAEATDRLGKGDGDVDSGSLNSLDQPMTPCPSAVEYVTPVFAKNYQVRVL